MSLLLESAIPEADEILSLLAECGNAKETVISTQELLEKLYHDLLLDEQFEQEKAARTLERLLLLYIGGPYSLSRYSRPDPSVLPQSDYTSKTAQSDSVKNS